LSLKCIINPYSQLICESMWAVPSTPNSNSCSATSVNSHYAELSCFTSCSVPATANKGTLLNRWDVVVVGWGNRSLSLLSVLPSSPPACQSNFIKSLNLDYRHPSTPWFHIAWSSSTLYGHCTVNTVTHCVWTFDSKIDCFSCGSHFLLFMNYLRQLCRAEAPPCCLAQQED